MMSRALEAEEVAKVAHLSEASWGGCKKVKIVSLLSDPPVPSKCYFCSSVKVKLKSSVVSSV